MTHIKHQKKHTFKIIELRNRIIHNYTARVVLLTVLLFLVVFVTYLLYFESFTISFTQRVLGIVSLGILLTLSLSDLTHRIWKFPLDNPKNSIAIYLLFTLLLAHVWLGFFKKLGGVSFFDFLPESFQTAVLLGLFAIISLVIFFIFSRVLKLKINNKTRKILDISSSFILHFSTILVLVHVQLIGTSIKLVYGPLLLLLWPVMLYGAIGLIYSIQKYMNYFKKPIYSLSVVIFSMTLSIVYLAVSFSSLAVFSSIENYAQKHDHKPTGNSQGIGKGHKH